MIFNEIHFISGALGMHTSALVLLPDYPGFAKYGSDGKSFKALYLLHGLSDDETIWMRRTSLERYAENRGLAIIMPRGDRSFYCDLDNGTRYFEYIARDLPAMVTSHFRVSDLREDNYAAGLSMGGYGALKLALRAPERFSAAAALSAVTDWPESLQTVVPGVMGNNYVCPPEDDLYYLADELKRRRDSGDFTAPTRFFIGCGTEDVLLPQSKAFTVKLADDGWNVVYRESAGCHSWEFWDEYIQYVLEWLTSPGAEETK